MKIYTRTGDAGETGLPGGLRVPKDDHIIDACGTLDELNAHIGLLRALMGDAAPEAFWTEVQSVVLRIGARIASAGASVALPSDEDVAALEQMIDQLEQDLPALTNFILPGGSIASSQAHVCRCVCRRAERSVVTATRTRTDIRHIHAWLNRLSDLLFILARWLQRRAGVPETRWNARKDQLSSD